MHICFLTNEFPKKGFSHGGIGTFVRTFSNLLIENGHEVSVVGINNTSKDEFYTENSIAIYRIGRKQIKGLSWYINAKKINQKLKQIHSNKPITIIEGSELSFAFIKKDKSIKYVIRLHGGHHFFAESEKRKINKWKGFQEKLSFKKADGFIAVSNYVKNHTSLFLSYHNKPIEVIYHPINTDVFYPLNRKIERFNITFAGTVCEKKGVRELVKSFSKIKIQYEDAILNLYGRDWYYPNGESYIEKLKEDEIEIFQAFENDIVFHGPVNLEDLKEAYAKANVCIFPSHMETLGLVAPEAMAMGKIVMFTNQGPGDEIIENGVDGFLVNPYKIEELVNSIDYVLKNYDQLNSIEKNAVLTVDKKFNQFFILKMNIDFYSRLILN